MLKVRRCPLYTRRRRSTRKQKTACRARSVSWSRSPSPVTRRLSRIRSLQWTRRAATATKTSAKSSNETAPLVVRAGTLTRSIGQLLSVLVLSSVATWNVAAGDAKHGEYLARAGGCMACHTQQNGGPPYAGGRALKTPFGTFYGPNITPDADTGIGRWTESDFIRAMRQGDRPDGSNYFPAFPYPSFTRITDSDLSDLWAYLRS